MLICNIGDLELVWLNVVEVCLRCIAIDKVKVIIVVVVIIHVFPPYHKNIITKNYNHQPPKSWSCVNTP